MCTCSWVSLKTRRERTLISRAAFAPMSTSRPAPGHSRTRTAAATSVSARSLIAVRSGSELAPDSGGFCEGREGGPEGATEDDEDYIQEERRGRGPPLLIHRVLLLPSFLPSFLPSLFGPLVRPIAAAAVAELLSWTCKTKEEILPMPPPPPPPHQCSCVTWIMYGVTAKAGFYLERKEGE